MSQIIRLLVAIAAIVAGNVLIPDGTAAESLSSEVRGSNFRLVGGTALIVGGAFLFARTAVTFAKAHLFSDQ